MKFGTSKFGLMCAASAFAFGIFVSASHALVDAAHVKGMWLFEEGKGNSTEDLSGSGLNGKLVDSPKWVDGKFGKGIEFDGKASYLQIPDHENPTVAITLTMWAKSTTPSWNTHGFLVEKREAYIMHPMGGGVGMAWCVGNGGGWNNPKSWESGAIGPKDQDITKWHMYTTTYDSKTGKWAIYIDGDELSKMDLTKNEIVVDKGPIFVGNDTCCPPRFGAATVDEFAIFDVALTAAEIKQIMDQGLHQAVLAVQPNGKLSATWGKLKTRK